MTALNIFNGKGICVCVDAFAFVYVQLYCNKIFLFFQICFIPPKKGFWLKSASVGLAYRLARVASRLKVAPIPSQ